MSLLDILIQSLGPKYRIECFRVRNFKTTFVLSSGSYKLYMEPNNNLLYVHGLSNVPSPDTPPDIAADQHLV